MSPKAEAKTFAPPWPSWPSFAIIMRGLSPSNFESHPDARPGAEFRLVSIGGAIDRLCHLRNGSVIAEDLSQRVRNLANRGTGARRFNGCCRKIALAAGRDGGEFGKGRASALGISLDLCLFQAADIRLPHGGVVNVAASIVSSHSSRYLLTPSLPSPR
jgi:hypothetical protein